MALSRAEHLARLSSMVSPDQRAAYYKAHIDATAVNLSTAENILLFPFLEANAFNDLGPIGLKEIRYPLPYIYGEPDIRQSVATFLHDQWGVSIDVNDLFACSGVIAALELLGLALFKPGDVILVPAPMFYGFPWSFSQTVGMKFVPFPIDNGVNLTVADVKNALAQNPQAKLLVLTNPHNPLGVNYSRELQEEICAVFLENPDRHVIADEIYGCSQVESQSDFVSALSLTAYKKYPERIHVTWGLSKDFGLAGFRAGFVISKSPAVQAALLGDSCDASLVWFSPFITLNPYAVHKLFFDSAGPNPQLANQAMDVYRKLLKTQYQATAEHLKSGGIPYFTGNEGAIFFWLDLREYLDRVPKSVSDQPLLCETLYPHDDARERRLLNYIKDPGGVLLVRGQECFQVEPGFFRLCYTAEDLPQVTSGIDRMVKALKALPPAGS